jgi:hypothetical protein
MHFLLLEMFIDEMKSIQNIIQYFINVTLLDYSIETKYLLFELYCFLNKLFNKNSNLKIFNDSNDDLHVIEPNPANQIETNEKQKIYSLDATKIAEYDLKNTLTNLVQFIFGNSSK